VDLSLVNKYLERKGAKMPAVKGLESFKTYKEINSQVIKDAADDGDDSSVLNKLMEGAGVRAVIDDEFENLKRRNEEDEEDYGDEDNDDGIQVIEKDLDNWF
jgi:hypothetical protein